MWYFKQNISTVTLVKMFLIKDFYIFEKKKILKIVKKKNNTFHSKYLSKHAPW